MAFVKKSEEDGKWMHSGCAMCIGAPMKARVKDGRIVEVAGEDLPDWNGKICGKAISGVSDRVYPSNRILYPLKRIGERGEGKFIRCTWDEVIGALASKLQGYDHSEYPNYFEIWWGCPDQQDKVPFLHYWSAVMKTGISYLHGQACFGDHAVEKMITFGENHGPSFLSISVDFTKTKYAVIGGQNFPGNCSPCSIPMYAMANKAREQGCKFIVVDPKLSDSSAWCDEWIPIKPGTDATFALNIAAILIKENLYDEEFLLNYTNACQLVREDNGQALTNKDGMYLVWNTTTSSAQPLPGAGMRDGLTLGSGQTFKVEHNGETITCKTVFQMFAEEALKYSADIPFPEEKVAEIARYLGNNKPAVILYPGFTSGRYPNWFQTLRAFSATNMLLGNFEKPGGYYCLKHKFDLGNGWPEPPEVPDYRDKLNTVPGPWGNMISIEAIDKASCYENPRKFHPATVALPWLHFDAIKEKKVRAVLSSAENAALTQSNSDLVNGCISDLELVIVGEQIYKEFTDMADYVIPEASYLERYHLYQRNYIGTDGKEHDVLYMRSAVIPPPGEAKSLSWFLVEVAKKAGMEKYFSKLDLDYGWWDRMLKRAGLYPGVNSRQLIDDGPYLESHPLEYNLLYKPIKTRSGRFEMYSNELAEECYFNTNSVWKGNPHVSPLPNYIPTAQPDGDDEFILTCGKASWHQKSATQNNLYLMEDGIEGGCPYTTLYINTERAGKLDIADGDLVEVTCIGPTKQTDSCVYDETAVGNKERAKVKVTEGLHPSALWIYFASGHKSTHKLDKADTAIAMNRLIPTTVSPYAAGVGKNYSIVKLQKIDKEA